MEQSQASRGSPAVPHGPSGASYEYRGHTLRQEPSGQFRVLRGDRELVLTDAETPTWALIRAMRLVDAVLG